MVATMNVVCVTGRNWIRQEDVTVRDWIEIVSHAISLVNLGSLKGFKDIPTHLSHTCKMIPRREVDRRVDVGVWRHGLPNTMKPDKRLFLLGSLTASPLHWGDFPLQEGEEDRLGGLEPERNQLQEESVFLDRDGNYFLLKATWIPHKREWDLDGISRWAELSGMQLKQKERDDVLTELFTKSQKLPLHMISRLWSAQCQTAEDLERRVRDAFTCSTALEEMLRRVRYII